MSVSRPFSRTTILILVMGVLAFALLGIRFSPNWLDFHRGTREAWAEAQTPAQRASIEKAIFSGYSERGLHVLMQKRAPDAEIANPMHKIVRWRLLVPLVGRILKLPDWLTLGLAHLGCLALVMTLVGIGVGRFAPPGRRWPEAFCLALIAGATAPFFTSMGWVGYYDSLLAVALLGVAFARARWVVALACLGAPWIDERFVIGLPLALCVRWILFGRSDLSFRAWAKKEALLPLILVAGYIVVRLILGGSGGSHTVWGYLQEFVFSGEYSLAQRLHGAWAGLRVGWLLVGTAILGTWWATRMSGRWTAWLLGTGILATSMVGLATALDMSRSMVLLLPVIPLGWIFAVRTAWWRRFYVGLVAAACALALPATHVVATTTIPVDNIWTYSLPLMTAQNNIGLLYIAGDGVPQDSARAIRWLRQPAEEGVGIAQNNLGYHIYFTGTKENRDSTEAAYWLQKAAEQGVAASQENLGVLYANGEGVPTDLIQAHMWLNLSLMNGHDAVAEKLRVVENMMSPQDIARARELALQKQEDIQKKPRARRF